MPTHRNFEDRPAKRQQVPLLIGLMGPSGGGKTYSALRLATGIQRVTGGEIFVIDTEACRALHYAPEDGVTLEPGKFLFRHVEFGAPFGPLEYLAAVQHCVHKGAKIVIVDSMSHEHTGKGGVLEMHAAETKRLAALWRVKEEKAQMSAWQRPKSERQQLTDWILQVKCSFIFCFRAKEKIKIVSGEDPTPRGFMPIAGEEFVFEMTVNCLLMPNSGGVPKWQSKMPGERMMIKQPEQFRALFARNLPLSEDIGAELAKWASGSASSLNLYAQLRQAIAEAVTLEALELIQPRLAEVPDKKLMPAPDFRKLKALFIERKKIIEAGGDDRSPEAYGEGTEAQPNPVTGEMPLEPEQGQREAGEEG